MSAPITSRWAVWYRWLAATSVGAGAGFQVGLTIGRRLEPIHDAAGFVFAATLAGLLIGTLQSLVAGSRLAHVGRWPLATMAGALLAAVFGYFTMRRMPAPVALTVGAAATGAVLAAVQAGVLRRGPGSPAAWIAAGGVSLSLGGFIFAFASRGAGVPVVWSITLASVVYGAITGVLVARWCVPSSRPNRP